MYKYALGLNKKPVVRLSGLGTRINTPYTRDLIHRLNMAAITVLGNATEVLPLDPAIGDVAVLNVGAATEIQPFIKQLSMYTHPVEFQLGKDLPEAGRKALREKLSKYKRILVCVTEHRLAAYQSFFAEFAPEVPVVYVFFIPGNSCCRYIGAYRLPKLWYWRILRVMMYSGRQPRYFMRMLWRTAGYRQA